MQRGNRIDFIGGQEAGGVGSRRDQLWKGERNDLNLGGISG